MRRAGWTLVELILVIVVIGIMAVFVAPLVMRALDAYDTTEGTVATYAKMRYAMARLAREVREVRRSPADTANFDISLMNPNIFRFFKADGQEVEITTAGNTVTLNYVGTASGVLTDQVSAFAFAYYQQDGVAAAGNPGVIAVVEINLTLVDGSNTYPSRLRLDLRNPQ